MADIAKIELVVKSSIGQLVTAEQVGDFWCCQLMIPKNVDGRLQALGKAFPGMIIDSRSNKGAVVRIPAHKNQRPSNHTPELWSQPRPLIAQRAEILHPTYDIRVLTSSDQVRRLAQLYEGIFGQPCEVQTLDEGRIKAMLLEPFTYPFQHPLLALMTPLLPTLAPVAYASEQVGHKPKTSIFLAKPEDARPRHTQQQVIVHIDGAFRDGIGCYGVRYLMDGHPPAYLSGAMNCRDSNAAEVMAFLQALAHLHETARNIAIYTDSNYLTLWVQNGGAEWMQRAIARHGSVTVQRVSRDENKAAHTLANRLITRLFE